MEAENQIETTEKQQQMIDPRALAHIRKLELPIDGVDFKFNWSRMLVPELMLACLGVSDRSSDTTSQAIQRVLLKAVEASQKGLLTDVFNNPENYPLPVSLAEVMLKPVTDNETVIGPINTRKEKDLRIFTVPLSTDGHTRVFEFTSSRQKYADYEEQRDNPDIDPAEAIYNYLSTCLQKADQNDFALLVYDERNFTLPTKIYRRVTDFLSRTAAIIGELKTIG